MFWRDYLNVQHLQEGQTVSLLDENYSIKDGILRQGKVYSPQQSQTQDAFAFKWQQRDTYESDQVKAAAQNWLIERYCGNNRTKLGEWLTPGCKVLDAGCGSGFSALLLFGEYLNSVHYLGVDISGAVDVARQRFAEAHYNGEFLQADLLDLPFDKPAFDVIFSEGVLHHTDSTQRAVEYLSTLLVPGGRFLFYVYRKKGPVREFTDDHIRHYLQKLGDEEAWEALIPLTKLGKVLGDLNVTVDVPEDIPYLDIKAGKHDLQRLFYWHIFKAYYRPDWLLEEMNHVNFDWYRPLNCQRHTSEEITAWCDKAALSIEHMDIQEAGITVVARKL